MGGLVPPSLNSPSGSSVESSSQHVAGESPIGASHSSHNGRSRSPSIHLENDGITVFAAIDRGYTAAEKMHNSLTTCNVFLSQGIQQLGELIDSHMVEPEHCPGETKWLPINMLFALVNPHSVRNALSRALAGRQPPLVNEDDYLDNYTDKFCSHHEYSDPHTRKALKTSRRGIFAVLALLHKLEDAPFFANSDLWDKDLPLVRRNREFVSRADGSKRIAIPGGWRYPDRDGFGLYQHCVLSPFFDMESPNDVSFHDVDKSCPLPFIEELYDERPVEGHHGTVWKVKIHPAHHNFATNSHNPYFAIKQLALIDSQGSNFETEVGAWAKSVGIAGHPHIIRLLATWHQQNTWYLLFPWADGGNLHDYWEKNPEGNQRREDKEKPGCEAKRRQQLTQWVAEQLKGLTEALAKIHRSPTDKDVTSCIADYGIHGDVKPQNILHFKDEHNEYDCLVICDFGFTRYHSKDSRSAASPAGNTRTYRAPEYDKMNNDQEPAISRACDLWALGCVYLEFMVWYLEGYHAMNHEFTQERLDEDSGELIPHDKFFVVIQTVDQMRPPGAIVKPCVMKRIRSLRRHIDCSQFCHDVLNVVEKHLLAVDPKKRMNSHGVAKRLGGIFENSLVDGSYCLDGRPRHEELGALPEVLPYPARRMTEMMQSERPPP
ncbi:kinase-like domain-containing protein, partial [Lasiosphaeria ovina]